MTVLYLGVAHTPLCGTHEQLEEFTDWVNLAERGIYYEQGQADMGPVFNGLGRNWRIISSYRGFTLWQRN